MEKETKIVLATKGENALYLFIRGEQAEFVVAYSNGPVKIGDYVESWCCGHYFYNLEDAVEFLKTRKY
jgi:hypothetical protein